jgi:hypothetical protein
MDRRPGRIRSATRRITHNQAQSASYRPSLSDVHSQAARAHAMAILAIVIAAVFGFLQIYAVVVGGMKPLVP